MEKGGRKEGREEEKREGRGEEREESLLKTKAFIPSERKSNPRSEILPWQTNRLSLVVLASSGLCLLMLCHLRRAFACPWRPCQSGI